MAPVKTVQLQGGKFPYRYYKNPTPKINVTVVLLAGGTGLADGLFLLCKEFKKRFSFITFNYPKAFPDNSSLADAVAELIESEQLENVYLLGQSYGGLLAQLIAKRHPHAIKGLLLSSTASMSNNLNFLGFQNIYNMVNEKRQAKNQKLDRLLPLFLISPLMKLAFKKHIEDKEKLKLITSMLFEIKDQLTNDYLFHMDGLLGDLRNHLGTHTKENFTNFKDEVLIIAPDDDQTFHPNVKQALFNLMTDPVIVTNLEGGHIALMLSPSKYMAILDDFLSSRN